MDDSKKKVLKYFEQIENHILNPINEGIIEKSCFATIMLLFSGVDGLGKLTHSNRKALPGIRFKYFISTLGKKYKDNAKQLWAL